MERYGSGGASALSWQLPRKTVTTEAHTHVFFYSTLSSVFNTTLFVCVCLGWSNIAASHSPQTSWQSHRGLETPFHHCGLCTHVCASYLCIFTSALLRLSGIFKSSNGRRCSRWSWDEGRGDKCSNANQHTLVSNRLFCFSVGIQTRTSIRHKTEQYDVEQ